MMTKGGWRICFQSTAKQGCFAYSTGAVCLSGRVCPGGCVFLLRRKRNPEEPSFLSDLRTLCRRLEPKGVWALEEGPEVQILNSVYSEFHLGKELGSASPHWEAAVPSPGLVTLHSSVPSWAPSSEGKLYSHFPWFTSLFPGRQHGHLQPRFLTFGVSFSTPPSRILILSLWELLGGEKGGGDQPSRGCWNWPCCHAVRGVGCPLVGGADLVVCYAFPWFRKLGDMPRRGENGKHMQGESMWAERMA